MNTMREKSQEEVILKVEGMSCAGCSNRVRQALIMTHGILESRVNHKKGRAIIAYDPDRIQVQNIIEHIEELGFTAGEVD